MTKGEFEVVSCGVQLERLSKDGLLTTDAVEDDDR